MLKIHRYAQINKQIKTFYFCDICGQLIVYDPKQLKSKNHKSMYVPFVSGFTINEYDEIVYTNYIGDYHFHPNCFEKLKNGECTLIKRKTNKYGRESFTKSKDCPHLGIVKKCKVIEPEGFTGACFSNLRECEKMNFGKNAYNCIYGDTCDKINFVKRNVNCTYCNDFIRRSTREGESTIIKWLNQKRLYCNW